MKTIIYQCDASDYCAEHLWEIRSHIHGLCKSDQKQYDGDIIYRVVNGVTDENWSRRIVITDTGRILFRKEKPFIVSTSSFLV